MPGENLSPRLVEWLALDIAEQLARRRDHGVVVSNHCRGPDRAVNVKRQCVATNQRLNRRDVNRVRIGNRVQGDDRFARTLHVGACVEVADDQVAFREFSDGQGRYRQAIRVLSAVSRIDGRADHNLLVELLEHRDVGREIRPERLAHWKRGLGTSWRRAVAGAAAARYYHYRHRSCSDSHGSGSGLKHPKYLAYNRDEQFTTY